jgi:Fe2+ transport system protein FeoA
MDPRVEGDRPISTRANDELEAGAISLVLLPPGASARLMTTRLDADTRDLLRALGLTDASTLQVCKPGDPFIIRVRETRLGLSRAVAEGIFVITEDRQTGPGVTR